MSETYLVRAKLEFALDFEVEEPRGSLKSPHNLPVKFGPFLLDHSPNLRFYLMELGFDFEGHSKGVPHPNWEYPVSLLYVETKIEAQGDQHPATTADDTWEQLEAMLRLFQEGNVYLRRHDFMRLSKQGALEPVWFGPTHPTKAEPDTLYDRGPYRLDDETLGRFIDFFNSYWNVVHQKPQPLYNALYRFNSSYESRTLADRLIELVIALEALFGDGADSLTYKIALRCATFLYPAGEAREKAFKTIKKVYGDRSDIVHGRKLDTKYSNEEIRQLEQDVRSAIIKFLEQHKKGNPISSGEELDSLLFFGKQ